MNSVRKREEAVSLRKVFGGLPRHLLLGTAVGVLSLASPAQAGEAEVIMKLLLQKGIITKAEYAEVMGELAATPGLAEKLRQQEAKIDELAKQQQGQAVPADKSLTPAAEAVAQAVGGLHLAGGVTMIAQGTSGNDRAVDGDVTDGSYSADLELSAPVAENGLAFLHIEGGEGNGIEGDELTSFWGVNGDAGDSSARLEFTEAWYEHRFLEDALTLTVGKLDLTKYFDGNAAANDETTQFLANGFVNSVAVEFPSNSAGARLTVSPSELLDLSVAWQSGDGDWEDLGDNSFYMAEVAFKPAVGDLKGNYRFYGWTNQTDHSKIIDDGDATYAGWGAGISFDQQLSQAVTAFVRAGYQDEDIYDFDVAWSAGLALAGSLWGREKDEIGLAYGMAMLSDDYETDRRDNGINPDDEGHLELYYRYTVNDYLAITPDLQVMTNAGGDGDYGTVWLGAVRGQLSF
ncbi:MAG: carbohydrate porin [Thermodesulfobacteriota bacterium]